jgi:hypothetical protein
MTPGYAPDRMSPALSRRMAYFLAVSGMELQARWAMVDRLTEAAASAPEGQMIDFEDLPEDLQEHVRRVEALAASQ